MREISKISDFGKFRKFQEIPGNSGNSTDSRKFQEIPDGSQILINLSGRGDKDIFNIAEAIGDNKWQEFLEKKTLNR